MSEHEGQAGFHDRCAALKIGLKLYETGYRFGSNERARVYLTNALEPAHDFSDTFEFAIPALAHEAQAVNEIKTGRHFTVIIGNPPYAVNSANKNSSIDIELSEYKSGLVTERNLKPLNDDYIKFLRFSHLTLLRSSKGLMGMITNHSYTTARLFRSMRRSLLQDFQEIFFLDLRGDTSRDPAMAQDQNVFEIQQGVGIGIYVRNDRILKAMPVIKSYELIGPRESKYSWLVAHSATGVSWSEINPCPELYRFESVTEDIGIEYRDFWPIDRIFGFGNVGYQTHRDEFAIDISRGDLISRIEAFREADSDPEELSKRFHLRSNRDWSLTSAHKVLSQETDTERHVRATLYRPFDIRYIYYAPYMIDYDRNELMRQMRNRNLGLLVSKMFDEHEFTSALATRLIVESKVADRTRGSYLFPLRLNASTAESSLDSRNQDSGRTNLTPAAIKAIGQQLGVTVRIGGSPRERLEITDLDVFSYVYAILYSADYRSRYLDFLKNDFPRLPLTGNRALFHRLIQLGGELVSLHLMESSKLKNFITNYSGPDNPRVERVGWAGDTVWLDAAATKKGQRATPGTVGFRGVSEAVWNFHIGGYKVCEKWLKDRKGRTLSHDDLAHYKKIVAALSETIRLMQEVDEVIEQYGGWPGAFAEPKEKAMVTDQVALIDKSHVSARPN